MLVIARFPPQNSYHLKEIPGVLLILDEQKHLNSIFREKYDVDGAQPCDLKQGEIRSLNLLMRFNGICTILISLVPDHCEVSQW